MGTTFLRRRKSTLIAGAGDDARDLSAHLCGYLDHSRRSPSGPSPAAIVARGPDNIPSVQDHEWGFRTRAIHAGNRPDATTGARAVPIYQTTAFVFEDAADAADLFALQKYGNIYTRIANPTVAAFEERMASLEGGIGAVATSSGQAAEMLLFTALAGAGDHIVASAALYGGTHTLLDVSLRRLGIDTTFVAPDDPAGFVAAARPETKAFYTEIVANPSGVVADLESAGGRCALGGRAARRGFDHGHPVPVPPVRAWRGRGPALGHQVHRGPRHVDGRGGRGERALRLGERAFPANDRAGAQLRRLAVLGQLRRVRLLHAATGRAAARFRRLAGAAQRVPSTARTGDPVAADGGPRCQCRRSGRVSVRPPCGGLGRPTPG